VGIAAGGLLFIRAQRQQEMPAAQAPPAAAPAQATPSATAEPARPANDPQAVALKDLPPASEAVPSGAPRPATKGGPAEKEAVPATPNAEAKDDKKAAPPEKEKDEEGAKMKPAAIPTNVPDHPSTGAVQAAIGAVLGNARACVAGQESYNQAVVTFASDGSVQAVKVTGAAAGKPAEACIQAALMKARVQPFSRPTFSVSATVRP